MSETPAIDHVDDPSAELVESDDVMSDSDGGAAIFHPSMETDEYESEEEESEEYEDYEDSPVLQPVQGMDDSDDEGQYDETMAEFQSYASTTFSNDAHHIPHPDYYPHPHPNQTATAQSSAAQPSAATAGGPTVESGDEAPVTAQSGSTFSPTFFPVAMPLVPGEEGLEAFMPSHGNSDVDGSQNLDLLGFARSWARVGGVHLRFRSGQPFMHNVLAELNRLVKEVNYSDLDQDRCDIQGLNWSAIGTTRSRARFRRHASYRNYTNIPGTDHIGVC